YASTNIRSREAGARLGGGGGPPRPEGARSGGRRAPTGGAGGDGTSPRGRASPPVPRPPAAGRARWPLCRSPPSPGTAAAPPANGDRGA
ncbi:unnamed protein product, partial [Bubo scandiacus]